MQDPEGVVGPVEVVVCTPTELLGRTEVESVDDALVGLTVVVAVAAAQTNCVWPIC